jgi:hypothetical protein
MKNIILVPLILLSTVSIGQVKDSTIVILDPFDLHSDTQLSDDITIYTNTLKIAFEKIFKDSAIKNLNNREARLISRLKNYRTDFNIASAFSISYATILNGSFTNIDGNYEVIPLRQKSNGALKELQKIATENNARWIINLVKLDFFIDNKRAQQELEPTGNKYGLLKIQLYDLKTNEIKMTTEYIGNTSSIEWFYPCDEGEFKCIINHLAGDSAYEIAEYILID